MGVIYNRALGFDSPPRTPQHTYAQVAPNTTTTAGTASTPVRADVASSGFLRVGQSARGGCRVILGNTPGDDALPPDGEALNDTFQDHFLTNFEA